MRKIGKCLLQTIISATLITLTTVVTMVMMKQENIPKNLDLHQGLTTVEVTPIQEHHQGIDFEVDGEVVPYRKVQIVAEVAGRIQHKSENARLGRSVKKGEVLLEIDPADYELDVRQKKEALAQSTVNITENNIQITNTKNDLVIAKEQYTIRERETERYTKTSMPGVYSSAELDTVRLSLLTAKDSVQKLENQLRVYETQTDSLASAQRKAEADLALAELNLKRTKVTSPISGVVTTDSFELNSYIQKGGVLSEILDTSRLEIQCSLYMKQIKWIWLSERTQNDNLKENQEKIETGLNGYIFSPTPVTIVYELDGEKWQWDGTLSTLDGAGINAATRMVPCRVVVANPQAVRNMEEKALNNRSIPMPTLFSGMYVNVIVHAKPKMAVYQIPEKALLPGGRIWTATNGQLHQYSLHVASTSSEGVLFYTDHAKPDESDLVVISPLAAPKEGEQVHLMDTTGRYSSELPVEKQSKEGNMNSTTDEKTKG